QLPCLEGLEPPESHSHLRSGATEGHSTQTILLVDDEELLRRAVAKMLRARGFSVLEAGEGNVAVELFRAHAADVDMVLLDSTLPGLSGQEVFTEIREVQPRIKTIVTSAYGRELALAGMHEGSCLSYLRKPYQIDELINAIRKTEKIEIRQ